MLLLACRIRRLVGCRLLNHRPPPSRVTARHEARGSTIQAGRTPRPRAGSTRQEEHAASAQPHHGSLASPLAKAPRLYLILLLLLGLLLLPLISLVLLLLLGLVGGALGRRFLLHASMRRQGQVRQLVPGQLPARLALLMSSCRARKPHAARLMLPSQGLRMSARGSGGGAARRPAESGRHSCDSRTALSRALAPPTLSLKN